MRENVVEAALRRGVKARGGLCLKFTSPGNNGVPDRIVLWPGGQAQFVELKRPGRHIEPGSLQESWQRELRRYGFVAEEINSREGVQAFLDKYSPEVQDG